MNIARDRKGLIKYIQYLRYGPSHLREPGRVFAKLACIAKMLKMSVQKIRYLLQD